MAKITKIKIIFFITTVFFLYLPFSASAVFLGEKHSFFVDSSYDSSEREEISALLQRIGKEIYFFIDSDYWNSLNVEEKNKIKQSLQDLDQEFHSRIYPTLTSFYGSEWKPGIDKDSRLTILIHPMIEEAGGYFRSADEYEKIQVPNSNEKEMVYLNALYINQSYSKSLLAHEFTHLITFYQKNVKQEIEEEVWLNEARAEYAPTLLGYDDIYENSNLEGRVKLFLADPTDSLTEWQNALSDYGVLNLFTQYLVEQYGIEILTDSMRTEKKGINSLNYALKKNGFGENFSDVFTNWTITVLVNDCDLGKKYCYQNKNLKNLKITPSFNFLPLTGKSSLGVSQTTKNWAGNWYKIIGGDGNLKINFIGNPENLFKIPYLTKDSFGKYNINFFQLDENQRGEIFISDFGKEITSVIIIPSIQSKTSEFLNPEPSFPFFWEASATAVEEKEKEEKPNFLEKPISEMTKQEITSKIEEIQNILNQLQAQLVELNKGNVEQKQENFSCQRFEENLSYGLLNDNRVRCLQEFLKSEGKAIYPEGLVTGNFLQLTKAAVIRFQEKYQEEILASWGLEKGTGFVGSSTRKKINQLLENTD